MIKGLNASTGRHTNCSVASIFFLYRTEKLVKQLESRDTSEVIIDDEDELP